MRLEGSRPQPGLMVLRAMRSIVRETARHREHCAGYANARLLTTRVGRRSHVEFFRASVRDPSNDFGAHGVGLVFAGDVRTAEPLAGAQLDRNHVLVALGIASLDVDRRDVAAPEGVRTIAAVQRD